MAYGGKDRYNIKTDESMNYADTVDEVLAELVFDGAWRINYDKIEVDELGIGDEYKEIVKLIRKKYNWLYNLPKGSKGRQFYFDIGRYFRQVVDEIKSRVVAIEIFKSNSAAMVSEGIKRYEHFRVYNSTYYHNKKNRCQIVIFSDDIKKTQYPIEEMDEQDIIEYLCNNAEYNCIADPCMGQGLVGFYANKANKRFVGTELNEKRLAVLIERINKGKLNIKK